MIIFGIRISIQQNYTTTSRPPAPTHELLSHTGVLDVQMEQPGKGKGRGKRAKANA